MVVVVGWGKGGRGGGDDHTEIAKQPQMSTVLSQKPNFIVRTVASLPLPLAFHPKRMPPPPPPRSPQDRTCPFFKRVGSEGHA